MRKLLLVGWDAADWKVISPLVDEGLMPNTARLIETGVMGNLATLNPILSPMLWTSIATGKRPYNHGIHGFAEPDPHSGTVRPITNLSRKTKAVWNILNQTGKKSLVVGWWPSSPAEPINGAMVSNHFQQAVADLDQPWPIPPGTVHPAELAGELGPLRIHPYELDGELLRNFVPRAPEIDQGKDKRLLTVAKIFAECSGIHAAATHLIANTPEWDFAAVYYDAIDHFCHGFMRYHPPRLDWIDEQNFELYKDVVKGGYIYHDMMLGTLINLSGPDTTVMLISDHGFQSDHLRPKCLPNEPAGPAAEHRQFGIFVANGPGIRSDDLVFGASLLDVTPTILNLFGLPVGRDMDGRALTTIYQELPSIDYIDSWDDVTGDDGRHPPDTQLNPVESKEAIQQLVDLGYIDRPDQDTAKSVEDTTRELQYNLARAYMDGGKLVEAAAIFSNLWDRWPEESRFGVHLLQSHIHMEDPLTARDVMNRLRDRKQDAATTASKKVKSLVESLREKHPASKDENAAELVGIDWDKVETRDKAKLMRLRGQAGIDPRAFAFLEGSLLQLEGRFDKALNMLQQATAAQTSNLPSLYLKMGDVCVDKRDWDSSAENYRKVLELDPLSAQAHFGLARVALNRQDWPTVASEALAAAGQHFHYAPSHFLAGLALWRLGNTDEALAALRRAVTINPAYPAAHRMLARFMRAERGDWPAYDHHLQMAREARKRRNLHSDFGVPEDQQHQEFGDTLNRESSSCPQSNTVAPDLPPLRDSIVVVTGLPRTGTSMMMQMLSAGGVSVLVDDHRPADESNRRGYFEYEAAKKLACDASWIGDAKGKTVKIVAQLLQYLPPKHRYRIVFMHRPLSEVIASQKKLLNRLGKQGASLTDDALKKTFQRQVTQVRTVLAHYRKQGVLDFVDIKYHDAMQDPTSVAQRLREFLDNDFDATAAAKAVDPKLRNEFVSSH